jgi:hypothetical protein
MSLFIPRDVRTIIEEFSETRLSVDSIEDIVNDEYFTRKKKLKKRYAKFDLELVHKKQKFNITMITKKGEPFVTMTANNYYCRMWGHSENIPALAQIMRLNGFTDNMDDEWHASLKRGRKTKPLTYRPTVPVRIPFEPSCSVRHPDQPEPIPRQGVWFGPTIQLPIELFDHICVNKMD